MTELAKRAINKYKNSNCLQNCGNKATLICCWKNIEPTELSPEEFIKWKKGELPNSYFPFCDKCANDLYEKVKYQDFWINLPLYYPAIENPTKEEKAELDWLEKTGRI